MTQSDDLKRENEALRARSATLNAAILRINASLDLDTVLSDVVESARGLTGARYGFIVTLDEAGATVVFVFSGLTAEEQQELLAWPCNARDGAGHTGACRAEVDITDDENGSALAHLAYPTSRRRWRSIN